LKVAHLKASLREAPILKVARLVASRPAGFRRRSNSNNQGLKSAMNLHLATGLAISTRRFPMALATMALATSFAACFADVAASSQANDSPDPELSR
jgi:hypothetical protein